jgi:hypothetical protein
MLIDAIRAARTDGEFSQAYTELVDRIESVTDDWAWSRLEDSDAITHRDREMITQHSRSLAHAIALAMLENGE